MFNRRDISGGKNFSNKAQKQIFFYRNSYSAKTPLWLDNCFSIIVDDLSFISATERINWKQGVFPYSVDKNTSLGMWRSRCFTERRVTENATLWTGDLFHRGKAGRTGHRTYPTCITIHTYIQSYHNTKSVACEHPTSIVFLTIEIHYLCSRFRSSSLISWKMFQRCSWFYTITTYCNSLRTKGYHKDFLWGNFLYNTILKL